MKDMDDIESVAGVRGEREKEFVLVSGCSAGRAILTFFVKETKITVQTVSVRASDIVLDQCGHCTDGRTTYLGVRRSRQG